MMPLSHTSWRCCMKISDEKRRKVAARLRGLDVEITSRDTLERAVGKFTKAVCGDIPFSPIRYSVRNLCGLAAMLADLIDPTCRNVSGYKDTLECSEYRCKVELITEACNEHGEPFHVPLMPSYCPNCRARVVNGDE